MTKRAIIPIILCGGTGSRLWPLSRKSYPKQYIDVSSENKNSLLQKTIKRITNINNLKAPILVCNEEHRFIAAEQIRELGIKATSILLEPFGRNTAPAVTLAALIALKKEEDPLLVVLSSDHEVKDNKKFIEAIEKGINYAEDGNLVTFGVVPNSPETGYGYIKSEKPYNANNLEGENIIEFTEKPELELAKEFLKDKRYYWNSGIFAFKAKTIIKEIENLSPEILICCKKSINQSQIDLDFQRIEKESFKKCQDISIDVAVMEKTKLGKIIPMSVGWSDIGNWNAMWDFSKKDDFGNHLQGNILLKKSKNCYVKSENKLLVGLGLENIIIVDTNDATLIANRDESQGVKNIVKELIDNGIPQGITHQKVYRPWGHYQSLVEDPRWQVKLIYVKPGEKLSLQMHHHRSEHWVVVSGTAKVENGEKIIYLSENQGTYIPLGAKHRLTNPGKIPLTLIEVQSGSYVGEDDIVRFEDKYGR